MSPAASSSATSRGGGQGSRGVRERGRTGGDVSHEPLATLQMLSNFDKHRRVQLTVWYVNDVSARSKEGLTVNCRINRLGELPHDGDGIGWWVLDGTDEQIEQFWPQGSVGLTFQYHLDLGWHGSPVDHFLERLLIVVGGIVIPLAR